MLLNNKHNESDNFSQLIKSKLEGHQLQVDDNCWAEIEERLSANKPKRAVPLWMWISSGGLVAAAVALLFIFTPFDGVVQENNFAVHRQQTVENGEKAFEAKDDFIAEQPTKNDAETSLQTAEITSSKSSINLAKTQTSNENKPVVAAKDKPETEEIVEDIKLVRESPETYSERREEQKAETGNVEKTKKIELPEFNPYDPANADWQPKKKKKQNSWLLAASVNTGGRSISSNRDIMQNISLSNDFLEAPDNFDGITAGETSEYPGVPREEEVSSSGTENRGVKAIERHDFSTVSHLPPLSFGLRVRKDFNKHFAIESGLTYSYLASKFSDSRLFKKEADLKMHYLGIPLNAVVYFANNPKWNAYFLAGGTVEKGIWASYHERTYLSDNNHRDYSESDRIAGFQWSLNASFGIGYNFYRDFSIYFEPNIAYYLENNQPLSSRTESPLIVGLNAGIRWRLP